MTIRFGDETVGEAREREQVASERQRRQVVVRPTPTPPPPPAAPTPAPLPTPIATPTPPPVSDSTPVRGKVYQVENEGEFDETVSFWEDRNFEVGDEIQGTLRDRSRPYTVLEKAPVEGTPLWNYRVEPADVFRPWQPDPELQEATADEFVKFVEIFNSVSTLEDRVPGELRELVPVQPPPIVGTPETVTEGYGNIFLTYKNLQQYAKFMDRYHADAVQGINEAQREASPEAQFRAGTLNPLAAVSLALSQIQEEHPDNYSEFLSSEAGLNELWNRASTQFLSVPPPVVTLDLRHPGVFVSAVEEAYVPDVPFLKDALQKATEIGLDPIFVGTMAVFPLAAGASKTRMMLRLAVEIGAGEEAAEAVGLPPIVGAVAGPLALGPAIRGFTRGLYKSALQKARVNPVAGEPATEVLRASGGLPNPQRVVGPNGETIGEAVVSPAEARAGRHTLQATGPEGAELGRLQWRTPGHIMDVVVQAEGQGLGTSLMERALADISASGAKTATADLNTAAGIRLFNRFGATLRNLKGSTLSLDDALKAVAEGKGVTGSIALDSRLAGQLTYQRALRSVLAPEVAEAGARLRLQVKRLRQQAAELRTLPARGRQRVANEQQAAILEAKASSLLGEGPPLPITLSQFPGGRGGGALPAVAGGADGATVPLLEQVIEANITRPAAQDFLRKAAGAMGHIPGVRQLVRAINISSIADDPIIQGGFGYQVLKDVDDAARVLSMAGFRGSRVPFVQNHLAQIWVPNAPAASRLERGIQILPRAVGKGGEWVAFGDVFESVLRQESKYLSRLTDDQVSWMIRADSVLGSYVRQAERAIGETISKRPAWWPRFVIDPSKKAFTVGRGPSKVPSFFSRVVESQQEAITNLGIRYRPDVLAQMDNAIAGFQRVGRDKVLSDWLKKQGIIKYGETSLMRVPAKGVSPFARGVIHQSDLTQLNQLIRSPSVVHPGISAATAPFRAFNNLARLVLTGTIDTGWGAIQLQTLAAVNPALWGEAMGRGFYNMIVEPKQVYRFLANNRGASRYATYGGNVGLETEFFEATRMGLPRLPGAAQPAVDLATFPLRTFINRLQTGFESTLLYSRVLAFDSMYEVATTAGKGTVNRVLGRAAGAPKELAGREFHNEMFRLARFVDTLAGQPKLSGIITGSQAQIESAFVWFATRYTRSVFGTIAYAFGKGYTPAQARAVLAKMMLGGAAAYAGLAGAVGKAQGKSDEEIQAQIIRGLNPLSGKEFMSLKMGDAWFGGGGAYRSMMAFFAGLGDKKNWEFEEWESKLWDNPFVKGLRSRTSPFTGTMMDQLEGEDFLGYPVNLSDFADDPKAFLDYAIDKFAPITADALVQDMSWRVQTGRFAAEFFGLRTSPETRFEAETAVMNRISNDLYGVPYDSLEHNMLAQDIVRSHPDVQRAAEGLLGVIRERERDVEFRLWDEARSEIRDRYGDEKLDLDATVTGSKIPRHPSPESWLSIANNVPQSSRMDGREYLERYGDTTSNQFHELEGLKAGFGFDFEDEEAPEDSVNAIMNQFFDLELEDYTDPASLEVDWETWFADRDAVLEQLPEEWKPVADEFLHKNETEVRRSFREAFEGVIEPSGYFQMREEVAKGFDISLNALEDTVIKQLTDLGRRAAPADVGRAVDKVLNTLMGTVLGDNALSLSRMRQLTRELSPRLDVELYRHGYVSSVRSQSAVDLAAELMVSPGSARMGYFPPPLAADVEERMRRSLGIQR